MYKMVYIPEIDAVASGYRLGKLMRDHGYSVNDLALHLKVSPQTIYKYIRGEAYPKTAHLLALCYLLRCDLKDLYVYKKDGNKAFDEDFCVHIMDLQ